MFAGERIRVLEQQVAVGNHQLRLAQQEILRLRGQLDASLRQHEGTQREFARLSQFMDSHGGREVWEHDSVIHQVHDDLNRLRQEREDLQQKLDPMRQRFADQQAALEAFEHPAQDSIELGVALRAVRKDIAASARAGTAVHSADELNVPATAAGHRRLAKDSGKLALRAFNSEIQNIITSATATNYDTSVGKIYRAAETIEKLGASASIKITDHYIELRLRELKLAVDHLKAKKIEREIEREHRVELREQAKAERELQAERERLEKEKQHYLNVLKVVQDTGDQEEAARLQERLVSIEKGLNDVEERAANIRAGYVYVISNIGSFGERMVKIGMTRRLEPMDRVKELSDASVPFNFDVHALFFSEDAVGVETSLHHHFADKRVNRINTRREFFYTTPAEVRDALTKIAGNLLEFTEEPTADQYYQSLQAAKEDQSAKAESTASMVPRPAASA